MKYFFVLFAFLGLSGLTYGQYKKADIKTIKSNKYHVLVMTISPIPVQPDYQDTAKKYIKNFEVLDSLRVDSANAQELVNIVLNTNNYTKNYSRSCEFLPKYAIRIGNSTVMFVSTGQCPKIKYYAAKKNKPLLIDMSEQNTICENLVKIAQSNHNNTIYH